MSEKLTTPFLPLGSMVYLEDKDAYGTMLFLIVARAIASNEHGEIISRYKVAPHPFGDIPSEQIFSIKSGDISEVVFEGFSNEDDNQFLEDLIGQMTNAKSNPTTPQTKSTVIPESQEVEEVEKEKLKADPFYKFRK
ncbi:DUF4176 domain-containing protein [Enterococcus faecalis]|uniref:DUF4176 domain-containing protein n=1 Tax=Enterococcus faecalis RP2S-4 TaxID=1244145 RepID=A0ABC9TM20_ENTFL|nr:DUF4176 domain-containing protein [Enterococcus faecalis]EPI09171.1 hypothetical protein D358_01262 [Enterococcus faecalis RP2S-4]